MIAIILISDPGDIICRSPARMSGSNVLEATKEDFCVDPALRMLTISLLSTLPPDSRGDSDNRFSRCLSLESTTLQTMEVSSVRP